MPPPTLTSTDTAQESPLLTAYPTAKANESTRRDYNIPVRSQMALLDDYERDNNNINNKDDKVEGVKVFVKEGGKPNKPQNNRKYSWF